MDVRTIFIQGGSDEAVIKSMGSRAGLVQVQRTVNGRYGQYTRMQWVRPDQVRDSDTVVGRNPGISPHQAKKDNDTTERLHKSREQSVNFCRGTVVTAKVNGRPIQGTVVGSSIRQSTGTLTLKVRDGSDRVHHVPATGSSLRKSALSDAEEFIGHRIVTPTYYTPGASPKAISQADMRAKYMREGRPGQTFDDFVGRDYFISDGQTHTDRFYKGRDGRYTPERQALHDRIVAGIVSKCDKPIEGNKPVCFLYGGGSASGKSSTADAVRDEYVASTGVKMGSVDSDAIKPQLPEYKPFQEQLVNTAALRVHDESSDIASQAIDACIAEGRCFAYDGTMKNLEKYTDIVDKLHKAGYDVIAIGTDIPTEEAIDRSKKRAAHTGRDVPEGIIRGSHGGFAMTFPKMMKMVDNYMLFDNSQPYGEPPTLICSRKDGIQNKARWDEFVRKGNDWAKHKEEEEQREEGK